MKRALIVALALGLTSCAGTTPPPPVIQIQKVEVPVPVPCVKDKPVAPDYPATDAALKAAPTITRTLQLLLADRLLSRAFEAQQSAVIDACAALPQPTN